MGKRLPDQGKCNHPANIEVDFQVEGRKPLSHQRLNWLELSNSISSHGKGAIEKRTFTR
jgi:hypothetical protein